MNYDKLILRDSASNTRMDKRVLKLKLPFNEKILAIVLNRIAVFFFLICLLAVFLYIIVTRQGFLDETQFLLLRLAALSGVLLLISAIIGLIADIVFFIIAGRKRYLIGFFFFIFLAIAGGIFAYAANFIIMVSSGNAA